jgi:hypothetical protein
MWRGGGIGLGVLALLAVVAFGEALRVLPIRVMIGMVIWLVISVPLGVAIGSCMLSSDD